MSKQEEYIRQPIIAVLGHVDHGKTSILDTIRKTNIHKKEFGAITQHIGASEVPTQEILALSKKQLDKFRFNLKIPGVLFIDTPGHEAFAHLRERGSSIADFAVLVIDITQGIQEQTVESINILKEYKTPFLIAANKIDLINGWIKTSSKSVLEALEYQNPTTISSLDEKIYEIIGDIAEHGFLSDRFDRIKDFTKEVAIIPISAKTSEGISELLLFIAGICQKFLEKELIIDKKAPARGTILEIVEVKGLGKTMNALIYDGQLNRGDIIIFPTLNCIKQTKVKALLKPKPLTEIRQASKTSFYQVDHVIASAGIKIIANDIEDAIPGGPLIELTEDQKSNTEITNYLLKDMQEILIKGSEGIVVKADTLGSLQALVKLLKRKNIPISSASIGPVTKDDIMLASSMAAKDPLMSVVLTFHIKVDKETHKLAVQHNVEVIESMIIYELIDKYIAFLKKKEELEKKLFFSKISLPCKLIALKNCCFRTNKPCIFGVKVLLGNLRLNDKIMNAQGKLLGQVKSIQKEKRSLELANEGDSVAISIEEISFHNEITYDDIIYSYYDRNSFLAALENWKYFSESEKKVLVEIGSILNLAHFIEAKLSEKK